MTTLDKVNALLSSVAGKNSVFKVVQYFLRLVAVYIAKNKASYWDVYLLKNYLRRLDTAANGVSLFRQFLRVGKTPLRLHAMTQMMSTVVLSKTGPRAAITEKFCDNLVSLAIDTAYGVVDETGLLFKLNVLEAKRMPRFRRIVGKLDAVFWYFDILNSLRLNHKKLVQLRQRLQHVLTHSIGEKDLAEIEKLEFEIRDVSYGNQKLYCDLVFDTFDVFGLPSVPYLYHGMGLGSGFWGVVRVWHQISH